MSSKIKKVILAFSFLCLAAAIILIIMMPKPQKELPQLPEAVFNTEIRNIETNTKGYIKIIKFPVISSEDGKDFTEFNKKLRNTEYEYSEGLDFPYQEEQNASYIINKYDIMLEAGDFLSCKAEGTFSNTTENYFSPILKSSNYNISTGEEIQFNEVVSNQQKFYKAFCGGKFTMIKNDPQYDGKSSEELLGNYAPEYDVYPDYYIDGESFVVIADIPTVMGGYTEFRISLFDAESFLNMDCDYIKMIYKGKY